MKKATATADPNATHVPLTAREPSRSILGGLLCVFVVAGCVLITDPAADMPFSDGFSYVKTALEFARTGHIVY
ncbi:MAG: hypothetical protein ABI164_11200, partial [Acidobacteriaceae bacterium]